MNLSLDSYKICGTILFIMRYYDYEPSGRERVLNALPTVGKVVFWGAVLGGIGWAAHEVLTSGPMHVSIHDFANNNFSYGLHSGLVVDNVNGSSLINLHHQTTYVVGDGGYGTLTGNEYRVPDPTAGSNNSFDVLLDPQSKVANYQFSPSSSYDLQGSVYTEVVDHTSTGADITKKLLEVDNITVDNGSTGLMNNLASAGLIGGLIGAARGLAKFPRLK